MLCANAADNQPVQRGFARTLDHHDQRESDGEEVVFEALAFLVAEPVHEKAVRRVGGDMDGNGLIHDSRVAGFEVFFRSASPRPPRRGSTDDHV